MPVTLVSLSYPGRQALKPGEPPRKRPTAALPRQRIVRSSTDTLSDKYATFLIDEILPLVKKEVNISDDPNMRAICGASSGGICAFTVAWERPDQFRKVLTTIGSFTNIRGGDKYPTSSAKASRSQSASSKPTARTTS